MPLSDDILQARKDLKEIYSFIGEARSYAYFLRDPTVVGWEAIKNDLKCIREHIQRLLDMWTKLLQFKQQIKSLTSHAKIVRDASIADILNSARTEGTLPARMAAPERLQWAQAKILCPTADDMHFLEEAKDEADLVLKVVDARIKDLEQAKQDLRVLVWMVRVHGVLGELGREAEESELKFRGRERGPAAQPPVRFPEVQLRVNLDDILPPITGQTQSPDNAASSGSGTKS